MRNIRVQEVSAGMMAGTDICDRSGRLLISSGTVLNDSQIRILKTWGISEINITGDNVNQQPLNVEVSEEHLTAAKQQVEDRFRFNNPEHPATVEFKRLLILREAKTMANQNAH